MSARRHLDGHAKRAELGWFEEAKSRGEVDPRIAPWCDRINGLAGVVTLQSCQGHRKPDARGSEFGDYVESANLWLWFDGPTHAIAMRHAPALADRLDVVEHVLVRFLPRSREIFDVSFRGDGTGDFDRSMPVVFAWVESVAKWEEVAVEAFKAAP